MRRGLILLFIFSCAILTAEWHSLGEKTAKLFEVKTSDLATTEVEFELDGFEKRKIVVDNTDYYQISYPGEGEFLAVGMPDLPRFSRLLAIPADAQMEVEVVEKSQEVISNFQIYPQQPLQSESNRQQQHFIKDIDFYNSDNFFPKKIVELGKPAIMRDLRIVNLTINPFQYNAAKQELKIFKKLRVKVTTSGSSSENVKFHQQAISRYFEPIYKSIVLNYSAIDRTNYQRPSYLFIYPDNSTVESTLQFLLDWKHRKGFQVNAVSTAETGTSLSDIKNYIQEAYDNWENPPEFITLVGDAGGSYYIPTGSSDGGEGDQYYVLLEGSDILADAFIGRLSFNDVFELQTIVSKILSYEKEPYMGNTNWYKKAAFFADPSSSGYSCISTKIAISEMMDTNVPHFGVQEVYDTSHGSWSTQMHDSINGGISYFNYRGYIGMSGWGAYDADDLNNGYMMPFVVSITCGTGSFEGTGDCISERFLKTGSPSEPRGAIGAISTATIHTHTCFNNCVDGGIYYGIFEDQIYHMGGALNRGKLSLYLNYPSNPSGAVDNFSYWNNLMGDPGLELWTNIPQEMIVEYEENIALGSNYLEVTVTEDNGSAIKNAWVTILKGDDEIFVSDYTDSQGKVLLPINATLAGDAEITVTKHNFIPHLGSLEISEQEKFVNSYGIVIDDDNSGESSGNDDGVVSPGEEIELVVKLKNYGEQSVSEVEATITCENQDITIEDEVQFYGTIEPNETSFPEDDVNISMPADMLSGTELLFTLNITDSENNNWEDNLIIPVVGAFAKFISYQVDDNNNGIIDPGESAPLNVTLMNIGPIPVENVEGVLNCIIEGISVNDSLAQFGTLVPGTEITNTDNNFTISVEPQILPNSQIPCRLLLTNESGFQQSISFILNVGEIDVSDPLGRDEYGYYAYEDIDTNYSLAPFYNWIEIDADLGGAGTEISLSDPGDTGDVETIDLPFTMKMYGREYDTISVCSNGWLSPGHTEQASFMNWQIPGPLGPSPMIAVFWDDLKTATGDIWYYYDEAMNYFIVEWSNLRSDYDNANQTFQAIIYDPDFYTTPYGDSDILFQYKEIHNTDQGSYGGWVEHGEFATIGLENHYSDIGLQYTYSNQYPAACAELQDERAILFTTRSAEVLQPPQMQIGQTQFSFALQENDSDSRTMSISNLGESNLTYSFSKQYLNQKDSGGPDEFGYEWKDSNDIAGPNYNWRDISDEAIPVEFPHNDESSGMIPLDFSFNYYGQQYDQFRINPNGWIGFGNDWTDYHNYSIPDPDAPLAAIFGLWDDLYPEDDEGGDGQVYYYSDSDSLVVWYNNVIHYPGQTNGTYDFQIIIYENGGILFQYRTLQGELSSATIGIQDHNGNIGLQVAYNQNYLEENLAIKFTKQIDWLQLDEPSGFIAGGETKLIHLTASSQELTYGNYECNLILSTNDPDNSYLEIPVELFVVSELPDIAVSEEELDFGAVAVQEIATETLTIQNTGVNLLEIYSMDINNTAFNCNTNTLSLQPGEQQEIEIDFEPGEVMEYSAQLVLTSNDPDEANLAVDLIGIGVIAGEPDIQVDVEALDFGQIEVGQDSLKTVLLKNNGELSLEISEIILESEVFSYTPQITTIEPGSSQQLTVTFAPLAAEIYESNLQIISNDPDQSEIEISLTGEGFIPSGNSNPDIPIKTALLGNYPNPFNPETAVKFSLNKPGNVELSIYNLKGQLVKKLVEERMEPGYYNFIWHGEDSYGNSVSSGVYFYKLRTADKLQIKKMMLIK
ncbi:MAG: hypothetical protein PWQ09_1366 [Candidatus Cloacimonadota bacterium]|jgi:hypothetical protein|nr:hypothetical protein [Candidatus Cloacimonadota bacterium]